jgi:hypothetical protein
MMNTLQQMAGNDQLLMDMIRNQGLQMGELIAKFEALEEKDSDPEVRRAASSIRSRLQTESVRSKSVRSKALAAEEWVSGEFSTWPADKRAVLVAALLAEELYDTRAIGKADAEEIDAVVDAAKLKKSTSADFRDAVRQLCASGSSGYSAGAGSAGSGAYSGGGSLSARFSMTAISLPFTAPNGDTYESKCGQGAFGVTYRVRLHHGVVVVARKVITDPRYVTLVPPHSDD